MAVSDRWQRTGLGRRLLDEIEAIVLQSGERLLWCNARTPAVAFYQRLGWTSVGEEFEIPTAGPHFQMFKRVK